MALTILEVSGMDTMDDVCVQYAWNKVVDVCYVLFAAAVPTDTGSPAALIIKRKKHDREYMRKITLSCYSSVLGAVWFADSESRGKLKASHIYALLETSRLSQDEIEDVMEHARYIHQGMKAHKMSSTYSDLIYALYGYSVEGRTLPSWLEKITTNLTRAHYAIAKSGQIHELGNIIEVCFNHNEA